LTDFVFKKKTISCTAKKNNIPVLLIGLPERSGELKCLTVPDLVAGPQEEPRQLQGGGGVGRVRPRIPKLLHVWPALNIIITITVSIIITVITKIPTLDKWLFSIVYPGSYIKKRGVK
jgi:hypothetical protein